MNTSNEYQKFDLSAEQEQIRPRLALRSRHTAKTDTVYFYQWPVWSAYNEAVMPWKKKHLTWNATKTSIAQLYKASCDKEHHCYCLLLLLIYLIDFIIKDCFPLFHYFFARCYKSGYSNLSNPCAGIKQCSMMPPQTVGAPGLDSLWLNST